jgi:DNA end-binding protein Ku
MNKTGRVGVGTFVMRGHQYLVAILSEGGILRAETLRFASELRSPKDIGLPKRKKTSAKTVKAFAKAIGELTHDELDLDEVSDWYAGQIHKLVERKEQQGEDVIDVTEAEPEEAEEGAEVIDLMKLLKERLGAAGRRPAQRASSRSRSSSGKRQKARTA